MMKPARVLTGSNALPSEDSNGLLPRTVPAPARSTARRCSSGKLTNVLLFFVLLGCGVLLGVVASLHIMGYFEGGTTVYPGSRQVHGAPLQSWLTNVGVRHSWSDEELLWRASISPLREGMPIKRQPKIAFMFLTKGPLPLAPIWEKYFRGQRGAYSIYVHAPPGYRLDLPTSSVFFGRQVPSQAAQWGEITMVDAERRLLANALLDFSNERFILLSESCVPVFNFTVLYESIINSDKSFVGAFDDPGPYGRGRWVPGMEPEVPIELWRKGAQWFEVKRKHATHIVADKKFYAKFKEFCVPNCYVDEHYIPTIMHVKFADEISRTSITFVDWSRGGSHPATFNARDVNDDMLWRITHDRRCLLNGVPNQICFFFARKFSPNTLQSLLQRSQLLGLE